MSRIAVDTNILVYRAGSSRSPDDVGKTRRAEQVVASLASRHRIVLPGQVLGEFYNVLTRAGRPREAARALVADLAQAAEVAPATAATYATALDLATSRRLQFWDALIIAAAQEAGCSLLLSEDMQDGFAIGGLTVADPFAPVLHPRLAALLDG